MRLSVLFWNVRAGKTDPGERVGRLAKHLAPDLIILAEAAGPQRYTQALNVASPGAYTVAEFGTQQHASLFVVCTRPRVQLSHGTDVPRAWIGVLTAADQPELVLAIAHLSSKQSGRNSSLEAQRITEQLAAAEEGRGHSRALVAGDLNLDPYDDPVTSAANLSAVPTRELAMAHGGLRRASGCDYPKLYNPMWSRFGDLSPGPAGTFFHDKDRAGGPYWHMLDQFLLRPELLSQCNTLGVGIVDNDDVESLLDDQGRPDRKCGSDHLPIYLSLT